MNHQPPADRREPHAADPRPGVGAWSAPPPACRGDQETTGPAWEEGKSKLPTVTARTIHASRADG